MPESNFLFDGRRFTLSSGRLAAHLADPEWCDQYNRGAGKRLSWSLELEANDLEFDDESIAPNINIDDLPVAPSNWAQLSGLSAQWNTSIRPETNDRYGMTYVWNHIPIKEGRVSIGARDGDKFQVFAMGQNEDGESFNVRAVVPFTGVSVYFSRADTADSTAARLAEFIDIENLSPGSFVSNGAQCNAGCLTFTPLVET